MTTKVDILVRFFFEKSESQQVGDDYLFTSRVDPDGNDTIITDTLIFRFNKDVERIRIKKISLSRSEIEYFSIDSFPVRDTLKWTLVEMDRKDSIQFCDSSLDIKLTTGKVLLKVQLDKKYKIIRNDMFKIVLDTLPTRIWVGLKPD